MTSCPRRSASSSARAKLIWLAFRSTLIAISWALSSSLRPCKKSISPLSAKFTPPTLSTPLARPRNAYDFMLARVDRSSSISARSLSKLGHLISACCCRACLPDAEPLYVPENMKSLRNRNVIIYRKDVQSKFLMNTFSNFSLNFLKCYKLDIFNLNYNQFFKEIEMLSLTVKMFNQNF